MRSARSDDREGGAGARLEAGRLRALRAIALCGFLIPALAACRSVTVVPGDESWTVTGQAESAEATWGTGTVEVTVPLALRGDATMLTGSVRNAGAAAAFVTFSQSAALARQGLSGTLSGERPEAGGRWTATLVPGRTIEVPAGTPESPGTVDFALSPDKPWTAKQAPEIGATFTWAVHVAGESGEASCPVLFHVIAASPGWVDDPRTQVTVIVVGLTALLVLAAHL